MVNRWAFEAFDKTLRDVMSSVIDGSKDSPFDGKTIVFRGDFRIFFACCPEGRSEGEKNKIGRVELCWLFLVLFLNV